MTGCWIFTNGTFYFIGTGRNTLWSGLVCQPIRGVHGSNRLSSWLQHFWPLVWLPFDTGNHYPILTEICDALEVDSFYGLGFSIACYILGILLVRLLLWTSSNILHLDRVSDSVGAMQYLWIFWQKGFFQQLWFHGCFHTNHFLRSTANAITALVRRFLVRV